MHPLTCGRLSRKTKDLGRRMEKLIMCQRFGAFLTPACKEGREKDTIDMGVFSKASAKQGFPGEGEDCMRDLTLVYSFIVPHCPQMCAGWKVPDVAAANTNLASH